MTEQRKLVIFGDGPFAEIAYEYFTHDSNYQVVAFTVSGACLKATTLFGLPVVAFESVETLFPPQTHEMFVALVFTKLNELRFRFYNECREKKYRLANYVSSRAFVWRNVELGDNCFIFENNVVQPFVRIGANTVLWSGNHIGHHSRIGSHCFISSHCVVSGSCVVEDFCFLGVNCTLVNDITVGAGCLVGAAALLVKSLQAGSVVRGVPSKPAPGEEAQKLRFVTSSRATVDASSAGPKSHLDKEEK